MTSFFRIQLKCCSDKRILRQRKVVTKYPKTLFKSMCIVRRDRTRKVHWKSRVQFWGHYWKLTTKHVNKVILNASQFLYLSALYTWPIQELQVATYFKSRAPWTFHAETEIFTYDISDINCKILRRIQETVSYRKFLEGLRNITWF
jgi:hypothetical protein